MLIEMPALDVAAFVEPAGAAGGIDLAAFSPFSAPAPSDSESFRAFAPSSMAYKIVSALAVRANGSGKSSAWSSSGKSWSSRSAVVERGTLGRSTASAIR